MARNIKYKDCSNEQGRSLTELLSVLAIMGVLSIAGVAGFNYAVDRHKANEVLNDVLLGATSLSGSMSQNKEATTEELTALLQGSVGEKLNGLYTVSASALGDGGFSVNVSDIPKAVCEKMAGVCVNSATTTLLNNSVIYYKKEEQGEASCLDTNNAFEYDFNDIMDDGQDVVAVDPTGTGCANKLTSITNVNTCVKCGGKWSNGACGQSDATNGEDGCPSTLTGITNQSLCNTCGGVWWNSVCNPSTCANGYMAYPAGTACLSCSYTGSLSSSAGLCSVCDNTANPREMRGDYCVLKNCPDGQVRDNTGGCASCPTGNGYSKKIPEEECDKCSGTEYIPMAYGENYCTTTVPSGYFLDGNGQKRSCGDLNSYATTTSECARCSQRSAQPAFMLYYCYLTTCPSGYFHDTNYRNMCYSCSSTSSYATSAAECASCGNRIINSNGYCVIGSCSSDEYLGNDAKCHSCTESNEYASSSTECAKCSNRTYYAGSCRTDVFLNTYNDIHTCQDSASIYATTTECAKCSNRQMWGSTSYCVLKECPSNYPNRNETYGDCEASGGTVSGGCYPLDTPIMLANGTCKRADQITYEDELLVWNFDEGCFDTAKPIYILQPQQAQSYNLLKFSDGSVLRTINQHRIFNRESGKFTYPMTPDSPLGTHTLNAKGKWVTLDEKSEIHEPIAYTNIITKRHLNCFSANILTSCRLNNLYPIKDLKFVKDDRVVVPYSKAAGVPLVWYDALRLGEQQGSIQNANDVDFGDKTFIDYVRRLIATTK